VHRCRCRTQFVPFYTAPRLPHREREVTKRVSASFVAYPGKTRARARAPPLVVPRSRSRSAVKTLISGPTLITNGFAGLHTDLTPLSFQRGRNTRRGGRRGRRRGWERRTAFESLGFASASARVVLSSRVTRIISHAYPRADRTFMDPFCTS